MSQGFQIACPHCGMQYAVTNPQLIGRAVPCSHCRQMFVAQALGQSGYAGLSNAYGGVPPPAAGANPFGQPISMPSVGMSGTAEMQTPFGTPAPRRRKGSNKGLLIAGLAGGGLLATVVLALVVWKLLGKSTDIVVNAGSNTPVVTNSASPVTTSPAPGGEPASSGAVPPAPNPTSSSDVAVADVKPSAQNTTGDTPAKVAKDALAAVREVNATMRSIRDPASRDAAIPKLAQLQSQFLELNVRVCRFAPLPVAELKPLLDSLNLELRPLAEESKQLNAQLQMSGLMNEQLFGSIGPTAAAATSIYNALDTSLRELPAAKYGGVKYELELSRHLRAALALVGKIESANDYAQAVKDLQQQTEEVKGLLARLKNISAQEAIELRLYSGEYLKYSLTTSGQLRSVEAYATMHYGENVEFMKAMQQLQSQVTEFQSAKAFAGQTGGTAQGPNRLPPGFPPGVPGGAPGLPQPVPGGPANPFFGLDMYIQRIGAANAVMFVLPRQEPQSVKKLIEQFCSLTDSQSHGSFTNDAVTTIVVNYSGDVQALADKIDFGTVSSVDKTARKIMLDVK